MSRVGRAAAGALLSLAIGAAAVLGPMVDVVGAESSPPPDWLISNTAVNLLNSYLGNNQLTTNAFDNTSTLVSHGLPSGWLSERTASFDAYGPVTTDGSFLYALAHGTIAAGTVYVLYDDENWSMTPADEQEDPGYYMAQFVDTAHENDYEAILAPATDLATSMSCYRSGESSWQNYLFACDIPALAAEAEPDIFEIQSQSYENDTSGSSNCGCYESVVDQAAQTAESVAPGLDVLAGLSSNPDGAVTSGQTLYTDTLNTEAVVSGYWLNVPQQSASCPDCLASGAPDVAVDYLHLLGYPGEGTQSITFTSSPPGGAVYGGTTYQVTATGGNSGNPVTFTSSSPLVCTVSGSTVSFIGVGTCIIDADQAGDDDFGAATETTQSFPVNPAPQSIAFTSSAPTNATYEGATYSVGASGGASGNPVGFSVDLSSDGACTLSGATVSFTGVGTCTIDANQAGDTDYAAAPQATQTIGVVQAAQSITFTSSPPTNATYGGATYTVTATGGASGNQVGFSVDPSSDGACTLSGATVSFPGVGTCTIDANEAGSTDYSAAALATQSLTVGQAGQSIAFTSTPPPDTSYGGASYFLAASGGASGNPVAFSVDQSSDGSCTLSGATVSFTGIGNCTIDANQAGSTDYSAAPQATQTIVVGQADQSITFTSSPPADASYGGTPYTVAATGGASGNPVVLSVDPSSDGACTLSGATVSFTGIGTCTVDANQAGNTDYSAAPLATQSLTVGQAGQSITFTSSAPTEASYGGSTYALAATGGASDNPVAFSVDPSSNGACTLSGATVSFTGVGSCTIDANQAGNTDYSAAPQATQTIGVGLADQSITFTSSAPADAAYDSPPYTVSATGGASGNPVVFSLDPSSEGACALSGATISFTGTGTCIVDADQAGNGDYAAASRAIQTIDVGFAAQSVVFTSSPPADVDLGSPDYTVSATGGGSGNPVVFSVDPNSDPGVCSVSGDAVSFAAVGTCIVDASQDGNGDYAAAPVASQAFPVGPGEQSITFTSQSPSAAAFGGPNYEPTATGGASGNTVTFSSGAATVCSVSGSTVSFVGVGTCIIDANQAGDDDYAAASQAIQSFSVDQASQSITFTSSPPVEPQYQAPGYVVGAGGGSSGNSVVFSVDSSSGSGVCSLSGSTVSFVGVGTCIIDANQAGNVDYSAAPQVSQTIVVGPASQSINFGSQSPTNATYGTTYTAAATGGGSGNKVILSSGTTTVCTVSGSTVSFVGVGTCTVDANQAGNTDYSASPQATQSFSVGQASQSVNFTSATPVGATYDGGTYTVAATGGGSGNPVIFSSATPSICVVSGSTVSFTGVGTCSVEANQAGDADYSGSPMAVQSFAIGPASQTVNFTSTPPTNATYGTTYTAAGTGGGSGNTVIFSSGTTTVCTVSGSTVSFVGVGTCTVDANEAGNADYSAAPEAAQSFAVAKASQSINFTSTTPTGAIYEGAPYTVTATGGGSGDPVIFSSATPSICVVSGATVTFTGAGACSVEANQAGNADYSGSPMAVQSFTVGQVSQTVNFTSTPPTNATYGGTTYTAAATGGGSGNTVIFSSGTTTVCTVSGSTVTFVGVGTCTVDAGEAGNADYSAAPEVAQSFPVAKASQSVNFTSTTPTGAIYEGSPYTVTATGGGSGSAITYSSGSTGVCTVSGSTVSFVGVGTCTVDANQAGNTDYAAAAEASQSFTVARAPQSISFTSAAPTAATYGGATYTVTATGGGSGAMITFSPGDATICAVTGSTVSFVGVGTCTLYANQAGNADYSDAEAIQSFNVSQASQSISFTSVVPTEATYGGGTYAVTATGGGSGNAVTFSSGSSTICTVSGSTVSFVGVGTCTVDANQAGSTDYSAGQAAQSFSVNQASQSLKFTSVAPTGATYGGATYAVTATGGGSGDSVTFSSGSSTICTVNGSTVSFVGVGTCTVDANQAGDTDYSAGQAAQSFSVGQASQSIKFTSLAPTGATYGGATYAVTATGGGSGDTVTFSSGSSPICTVSGSTVSFVGVGTCTVDANQAGNTDYLASPQATQSFSVGQASQSIKFTSVAPTGATYGGATYAVAATGGGSGNNVTFSSGTSTICTVSGSTVSFVGVGTCTVDANQAGDTDYSAGQAVQSFSVGQASQSIKFTSLAPTGATYGGATYAVTATGGGSGDTVTFSSGSANVCTVSGSTVSFVGVGTCTVDANQAGNTNYLASPQATQSFSVGQASQSIKFTSVAPTGATYGGATYAVAAAGGGSGNSVTFSSGASTICTVSGSTVSFVGVGTCTVDANQAGSGDYLAAPQAIQKFTVAKASQSITFTSKAPTGARYEGPTYTVSATGGGSDNAVTYSSGSAGVCTVSGSTVSFVGVGTCTVAANQAGNGDYLAAPKAIQKFTVAKASQSITFTSKAPKDAKFHGPSYSVSATGGGSNNAVVYSSGSASVCTVSGSTVSFVGPGTCTVDANQAGNSLYYAGAGRQKFTVVTN